MQRFDGFDGAPVSARQENAIRSEAFDLRPHEIDDLGRRHAADFKIGFDTHPDGFQWRESGFGE